MSFLSMMEARLPPGFRFHPRDDELICDYLAAKASVGGNHSFYGCPMLVDVDLNKVEPWDLPEMACVGGKEWYFFSLRDRKYATGQRTNRATLSGYWKATGKDRPVSRNRVLVGMRKTLVFYQGRAPKGKKTEWVMHEFRSESRGDSPQKFSFKEDWVLCRVFYKSRGIAVKPSTETRFEGTAAASSLPPLMDTYISFEQAPTPSIEGIEQVPCFSNNQASNTSVQHFLATDRVLPSKSLAHLGGLPDVASYMNQLACDNKVIQAVLSHLTKVDTSQKEEVQLNHAEGSSESYLTETGFTSMWNQF